jgi:hypothetical protein
MVKTIRYSQARIEELKDWQLNGDDRDLLQFESTEEMMEHLWDDYRVLKKKRKEGKKNKASRVLPLAAFAGEQVYKFVSMSRKFKRKSFGL